MVGSIWAYIVHSHNIRYLEESRKHTGNGMVFTADDASYISPPENFKRTWVWKDNTEGVSSYIQRPPMIGLINLPFTFIFTYGDMGMQKYVALLLHFFAIYLFGLMAIELLGKRTAIFVQFIYALLPCFWGYLFYYLAESITPSLLIFLSYGYLKYQTTQTSRWLLFQSILVGVLLLTRPQLGIFLLPFFYFLWTYIREKHHKKWTVFLCCFMLAFGCFGLWQIRSITIAKHWVGLHPIYDVTNNTQYRPVHGSFGELFKIWEHNGQKFHGLMTILWIESASSDSGLFNTDIINQQIHNKAFQYYEAEKFNQLFAEYITVNREIRRLDNLQKALTGEATGEKNLRIKVDSLTRVLRKKMWKQNYFVTPINSIKFMFSKSQLNLHIFQEKYRGFLGMEILRYICLFIIWIMVALSLSQAFNFKNKTWFFFAMGTILYLFYLFFIQKINEERYLIPLLPVLLLMAVDRLKQIFNL